MEVNDGGRSAIPPELRRRGESGAIERRDDLVPADPLVIPGERHLAQEVGVRSLDPVEWPKGGAEPHHAALAAHAGHLKSLGLDGHDGQLT